MIKRIIDLGADINAVNNAKTSVLVIAIKQSDPLKVKLLLDRGANPYQPLVVIKDMDENMRKLLTKYFSFKKLLAEIF